MFGKDLKKIRELPFSTALRAGLRVIHPSLLSVLIQDRLGLMRKPGQSRLNLDAAIKWLCRAQDVCGGGGVSAGYSLIRGWHPPYPETTGYIIPTFYDYARLTQKKEIFERARRMADWETEVQLPSGAAQSGVYRGPLRRRRPVAFNTGQAILGFCRAFVETGDERYLNAARKTGEKLLRIFELRRFMAGEFDENWKSSATYSCLTGDAQIAGVWLKLFETEGDARFLNAALKLNDFAKASQSLRSMHPGARGGVKGSQPIFGRYTSFTYVNWGAKFLADSLMLEERVMADVERAVRSGEPLTLSEARSQAASAAN